MNTSTDGPASSPETATPQTDAPETAQPSRNPLRELAERLKTEKAEPAEKPAEGDEKPKAKGKPKTLESLAESLGVEVKDLYGIEIPSSRKGEQPYTIGSLKDHAAERDDFTVRSLAFDEDVRRKEAKFARAEQELETLLAVLPKDALKPEVQRAIQAKRDERVAHELQRTIEVVPEWGDETVCAAELKDIGEFLKDYGLADTLFLRNPDHRLVKLVRDFWQQTIKLRKALGDVSERKPVQVGKSKPSQPAQKRGAPAAMSPEQRAARNFMATIESAASQR